MPKDVKIILLLALAFIVSACTVLIVGKAKTVTQETHVKSSIDSTEVLGTKIYKHKKE